MPNDLLASLRRLSDAELVARVQDLAARERGEMAQLIAHLAELDTRDVHFRAGYASLFAYCRDALALSEHEAYNRIEVARAARRFPVIVEMLTLGTLNPTAVRLLAPHLTPDNHQGVLQSARGKRKAEVEEIVARLSPRAEVPASVRRLPAPVVSSPVVPAPVCPRTAARTGGRRAGGTCGRRHPAAASTAAPRFQPPKKGPAAVQPLAPERYRLQLTIGAQTLQKLRLAQDLLRHAIPSGDEAAILDRALTALLEDIAKKKFAATLNPRAARPTAPGSRHIPAEVKRAVWLRDLARCAFVGTNGRRCTEHGFLEFHHVKPYAAGGEANFPNIQLRCRRHNDYEARVFFARDLELVPERVRAPCPHDGRVQIPSLHHEPVRAPSLHQERARPPSLDHS